MTASSSMVSTVECGAFGLVGRSLTAVRFYGDRTDHTINVRHRVGQPLPDTGLFSVDAAVPVGAVELYAFGTSAIGMASRTCCSHHCYCYSRFCSSARRGSGTGQQVWRVVGVPLRVV
jgi:hypothetical protein